MTIEETQNGIIREFCGLHDWLDRYEYLINMGRELEPLDHQYKTEENALPGCQSKVWIHARKEDNRIIFGADSDSEILKGILALLIQVLSNHSSSDVAIADLYFLKEIGLDSSLSPSRANGLGTIVKYMQELAGSDERFRD
ncbi:MAG: SufE family protein [Fibrobacterota bacterium]